MELKDGLVEIQLLPDIAPNHVKRIKELVIENFYDGLTFHRVIPGYMAQTGDPQGNGTGGSGQNINDEFSDYIYKRGTVGMARAMKNSGDSQFFICYDGCDHLTGQYTVFGQVISGMDYVDKITVGEPPINPDVIISLNVKAD